ncbi:alkyldihydroxyacetonephosphate synthase [Myxococcaceae bacterium]|nr:alkyldihydroxyacetonephosphate synthase [Myxococcaceae bacterium]
MSSPKKTADFPIPLGTGAPYLPVAIAGDPATARLRGMAKSVDVPGTILERLRSACSRLETDAATCADSSRDWWAVGLRWAHAGRAGAIAAAIAHAKTAEEVASVLRICNEARVPVTVIGGRSGVCGGSIPVFGGVLLDVRGLAGVVSVDDRSLVLDVKPGSFGDHLEYELRTKHGLTIGHWPQSMSLATVGGWIACRGAGQLSNRYGKIEDMVVGLDVALADGTIIRTGGASRSAVGPDLNQVFVGSEGTLGVIVGSRLRLHPAPAAERRAAFTFRSFTDALDACRRILRRGLPPAVLRLYDAHEANHKYKTGDRHLLLVLDEGDPAVVDASLSIVSAECASAEQADPGLVGDWLAHRNSVASPATLLDRGLAWDTMEITGSWRALPEIYEKTLAAVRAVPHTIVCSAHQSHAYSDGACLYFTFVGRPPDGEDAWEAYYNAAWDAGTRAVLAAGGNLSHHHGVGLNRARFMREALGPAFEALVSIKRALDPNGILNPGKLGLPSPFGSVDWP